MIDHDRKLLFIHIARTGGTSVEKALVGDDWWQIERQTKHLSASQARRHYGEKVWHDYTTFGIVRNPWDRFVSMWTVGYWHAPEINWRGEPPRNFTEFMQGLQPHPAEMHRTFHQHRILDEEIDVVLRFENLAEDFRAMLRARGLADVTLPVTLQSERKHYRAYYDQDLAELVRRTYATDIERFGYSF